MDVRSNTHAILKMHSCTFTYPGKSNPSLINVSCALSLSRSGVKPMCDMVNFLTKSDSRVGMVGPNGVGKSILNKLLPVRLPCTLPIYERH